MKKAILILFFTVLMGLMLQFVSYETLAFSASSVENESAKVTNEQDPKVLTNMRQLTFIGSKSGEGYFSQDGSKMIFQSEREAGNPFYQIYLMDLKSGQTNRVSTGSGKTTCAWVHPDMSRVMYSSTHLDKDFKKKVKEELDQRAAPQKNKYSWSFDDQFDIFEYNLKKKTTRQLTKEKGYDAEGSYSPDGQQIVFASNRHAYTQSPKEKMSEEDAKIFAMDPSYLMSIYIMNADGSNVRRLTEGKGYNGGPFFSADGKKITWRKFAPNGQSAEIWTMNIDGSEQKAITKIGAMSWAPFYHPSGDYIIFTTNKIGYSNFELYVVDSEGKNDPVRVSYIPDFDGLPVFSPDGSQLSWTHRNEKNESQIYIGDWDDQKARELLKLKPVQLAKQTLSPLIRKQDTKTIVQYLASEELAGRATGSAEETLYTAKLAQLFQDFGLKPYSQKSYFQEFEFSSGVKMGQKNNLTFFQGAKDGKESFEKSLKLEDEFLPLSFSKTGEFAQADVAFAGYGLVAPATDKQPLYDSYKDLDVKNKWVLVFRDIPENIPNERRIHLNMYSRLHHKALVAVQRGARGLLVVTGPNNQSKQKIIKLRFDGTSATAGLPILSISDEAAELILKSTGRNLKKWQDVLDSGETQNTPVKDFKIAAQIELETTKSKGRNVIARIDAKGAKTDIVIAAHGDHLGRGMFGSSLAKENEKNMIHYGADDNASGVAGVLELAAYFQNQIQTGQLKLKHNLIFAVWSGEEMGLIGSSNFVAKFANENKSEKIIANINMDMIGRLKDKLLVQGVGSAQEWKKLIEEITKKTNVFVSTQEDPYLPTDSMAFYMKEIPGLNFFTGSHAEYHSPRDTAQTLNYDGLIDVIQVVKSTIENINSNLNKLSYVKVESSHSQMSGRSFRLYLGTIPDYTQDGVKGVRISGTSKDSPAEKAGLKAGDVITELAGIKIENLYDYVYCLQSIKAGQPAKMKISRSGSDTELSITPVLKE